MTEIAVLHSLWRAVSGHTTNEEGQDQQKQKDSVWPLCVSANKLVVYDHKNTVKGC